MKRIFIGVAILLAITLIINFYNDRKIPPIKTLKIPKIQIVGSDKDNHGCISSAGYMWCHVKNKCLRIFEEDCSIKEQINTPKCKEKDEIYCPLSGKCGNYLEMDCVGGNKKDADSITTSYVREFLEDENNLGIELIFNDGLHAVGVVKNKKTNATDGYVYAMNKKGWNIVFAGKGTPLCQDLANFTDYPNSLLSECSDLKGNTVRR